MTTPSTHTRLAVREAESLTREALENGGVDRLAAERLGEGIADPRILETILEVAAESVRGSKGDSVTVSRNIFVPLTNLCRNRCGYCTFAKPPGSAEAKTYSVEEVAELVKGGVMTGCVEALFCLGDKPEIAYREHRNWLAERGYDSTTDHLVEACRIATAGGMLPHTNAGILTIEEMARLRPWNASMGLMLETTSQRMRGRGMPHQHAPDKDPEVRLRMHEEAGQLRIPFTSGILLGIGENTGERVDTLLAIRDLSDRYGHIQEVIIQPFHPKPSIRMRATSPISDSEVAGWIALARLIMGPDMNIQAPPNLAPEILELLLRSGLNDWGGVSPLTVDYINPEAPWPTLVELRRRTEAAGRKLVYRLPVYPEFVLSKPEFFDPAMREAIPRFATDVGLARNPDNQSGEEAA